ncbi:MAG: SusC/RagA family TonB-linked outer membrane protein [Marinifilum sp.]|jgi:TonB-linked SusC/RagA family outer membrane protein|nr:SusC/RagA family TonB-linked outer membrane protein [Marinifilum sp.]
MKKSLVSMLILFFIGLQGVLAQSREITGVVTSAEDGLSIPGVSVIVKGTTIGTTTDLDGKYSLNVPEDNQILVFSFVGMQMQEVEITSSTINVVMETESIGMDEVVVTAVGIKRNARSLSYSVQKVDGDDLENKVETDVLRALSGRVAGVNVSGSGGAAGASTNIVIRGNSSAVGSNQPLFVVDGVPFDNSNNSSQNLTIHGSTYSNRALDINPNDIESMSVLKGGAAAALYGSRASNGVIIITTKSGKNSNGKINVSYTTTLAMENPAKLPDYQNEYGQGANFQFNAGYFGTWGPRFDAPDLDGNGDGVAGSSLLFDNNGTISYTNHLGDVVPYKAFKDNVKDFFETGTLFENSVTVSGGNETSNFLVTGTSSNNDGFIPHTGLDKYSLKVTGNHTFNKKLRIGAALNYTNTTQKGVPVGGFGVTSTNVFGQLWRIPRSYNLSGFPYKDPITQENIHYRSDFDNPYYIAEQNTYNSVVNRVHGYFDAQYDFNDWLNFTYKYGFNTYTDERDQTYAKSTQFNDGKGTILFDNNRFTEIEQTALLSFNKDLDESFNLTAIAGLSINERKSDRMAVIGNDLIKHGITNTNNTNKVVPNSLSGSSKRRLVGVFADVTLGYKGFAFLNVTGRNDWSSTLPTNQNSYFYPSITGSVILTDAFDLKSNILSYWKVYGGVAKIGNDAGTYLLETTYTLNPSYGANIASLDFPFIDVSGLSFGNTLGNNDLSPEFTTEYEIGTDIQFFDNRIGFDFTYYDKVTTDQIFSVNVPASTGYISKVLNAGKITNKGVEVALSGVPVFNPNGLRWDINLNYSHNRSKVKELFSGIDEISVGTGFTSLGFVQKVGEAYGVIKGTKHRRDEEGNLLINKDTGYAMTDSEQGIIADPNPDFITSLSNMFSYKGVTLSFLLEYKKGGDLYSNTVNDLRARGVAEETAINREAGRIIRGVVADPNDRSKPLLDGNGNKIVNNRTITTNDYYFRGFPAGEASVYDATTIRLRELTLGYNLPKKLLQGTPFESATISAMGRNLWFYAPNIPHIDPETNGYGAGNRQGIEYYYIPNARRFALSLKVTL